MQNEFLAKDLVLEHHLEQLGLQLRRAKLHLPLQALPMLRQVKLHLCDAKMLRQDRMKSS
jgi:hypothetical protein